MKRGLCVVLIMATLFLSGCFYLRVQQVKNQLGEFDKYFEIDESSNEKICLIAHQPVLFPEDVNRIMGYQPAEMTLDSNNLSYSYILQKQYPENSIRENTNYDIKIQMMFENNLLNRVCIDKRLFAVIPKNILIAILKSLGGAKVNISKKQVTGGLATAQNPHFPDQNEVIELLGQPYFRKENTFKYQYTKLSSGNHIIGANDFLPVTFKFSDKGKLTYCESYLMGGKFFIDFNDVNNP